MLPFILFTISKEENISAQTDHQNFSTMPKGHKLQRSQQIFSQSVNNGGHGEI